MLRQNVGVLDKAADVTLTFDVSEPWNPGVTLNAAILDGDFDEEARTLLHATVTEGGAGRDGGEEDEEQFTAADRQAGRVFEQGREPGAAGGRRFAAVQRDDAGQREYQCDEQAEDHGGA